MTSRSIFDTTAGLAPSPEAKQPKDQNIPALTIISHPDRNRIGERMLMPEITRGKRVHIARGVGDFTRPGKNRGEPLMDAYLSRSSFSFGRARDGVNLRQDDSRTRIKIRGHYLNDEQFLSKEDLMEGVDLILADRIVILLHLGGPPYANREYAFGFVGGSTAMAQLWEEVEQVHDLEVSVLLRGETGTGKELLAKALHKLGPQKGRLVSVNLGALPSTLAASELFGTVKGAFTGAVSKNGYFGEANLGTLFLDEIGEAPVEVQTALLRALEDGEIFPVGSRIPVPVKVRLITATDANLEDRAQKGDFKLPLLQRLGGFEIWLPPLRDRREDIGRLFLHFADEVLEEINETYESKLQPWLSAELAARLCRLSWPGNVRQFRNIVRQLIISGRGKPQLEVSTKLERLLKRAGDELGDDVATQPKPSWRKPGSVTDEELATTLEGNNWDIKATAAQLNISRTSLYAMIEKAPNLRKASDLSAEEIESASGKFAGDVDKMARALKVSVRALRQQIRRLET